MDPYPKFGAFMKYGYPKTLGFPIDNDQFWKIWGDPHFRKPLFVYNY